MFEGGTHSCSSESRKPRRARKKRQKAEGSRSLLRKDANAPPDAGVEVLASVVRPRAVESKVSNRFNLTFSSPELKAGNNASADENCSAVLRAVLPADAAEVSWIVMAKHKDRFQDVANEATRG